MNKAARLVMFVFTAALLSHGAAGMAQAQEDEEILVEQQRQLEIEIDTNFIYTAGTPIIISGSIKTLSTLMYDVTVSIIDPNGEGKAFEQITPGEDGKFTVIPNIITNANWKAGDYKIIVTYGADKVERTITVMSDEPEPVVPECGPGEELVGGECVEIEVDPECGENQRLENGECVDIPPPPPECGESQILENGVCVDIPPPPPECGPNQELKGGECVDKEIECGKGTAFDSTTGKCEKEKTSSCIIATATYGTEMAPQVQFLREIRDNTLYSTDAGTAFMSGFNDVYYSFAPAVADLERESPAFREAVKLFITPMLASLSIMSLAEAGSESDVLGLGISVIALNLGMYIAAPALIGISIRRRIAS